MSSRLTAALLLVSAIAVGGFHAVAKARPTEKDLKQFARGIDTPRAWQGKYAPNVGLTTLDGERVQLQDLVGEKIVVLNFFATWCGPCREEMPELGRFMAAHRAEPIVWLGIDANESRQVVDKFLREVDVAFPIAIDDGTAQQAYGVTAFPTTVVIGADGRVQLYEAGAIMNADIALAPIVKANLAVLNAHGGVTRTAYLEAVAREDYRQVRDASARDSNELSGRARQIAEQMPCPCGCSDTVAACSCKTSKNIKARLKEGHFADKSNADIMTELNREFCMKDM
jgi:thiol-disulfide isomerase/thioredoxin